MPKDLRVPRPNTNSIRQVSSYIAHKIVNDYNRIAPHIKGIDQFGGDPVRTLMRYVIIELAELNRFDVSLREIEEEL